MTQLGGDVPDIASEVRSATADVLDSQNYKLMDASSEVTGRDFLLKIWKMALSVPVGIAIVHSSMSPKTVGNIFYELGLMQAYGKETVVIKTQDASIPSDFVRTEYVEYGPHFNSAFEKFIANVYERAQYYVTVADQLENNPLLAVDYLRRAYLITGDEAWREQAREVVKGAGLQDRAKDSVELLLAHFCTS